MPRQIFQAVTMHATVSNHIFFRGSTFLESLMLFNHSSSQIVELNVYVMSHTQVLVQIIYSSASLLHALTVLCFILGVISCRV